MLEDLPARYHEYLARFAEKVGDHEVGKFAKYNARLIKKLSFEEFTPAWIEFSEIASRYQESVDRGDTINDIVLRILRDKSANLVLESPG